MSWLEHIVVGMIVKAYVQLPSRDRGSFWAFSRAYRALQQNETGAQY